MATLEQIFFRFLKENNAYEAFKRKYQQRLKKHWVTPLNINHITLKEYVFMNGLRSPKSLLYNNFLVDDDDDSYYLWYNLFRKWNKLCTTEKLYAKYFKKNKT